MERRRVTLENIYIGDRHREPDMAKVREIAKSISEVGLLNPPAVVFRDGLIIDGEEAENTPVLIYGRHRVLALQELGEVTVDCVVHDVDDLHAELMEIDENLARSELSPAEEAAHIARRKAIWEEIGQAKQIGPIDSKREDGKGHRQKQFASEIAEVTGGSKVDINRKLRRVEGLGPDIRRVVGTSLDKGVELDALIKLPEPERTALIDRAAQGEKVSARPEPAPRPVSALEAMGVMANDIPVIQENEEDDDEEERQFWVYFAGLSPRVQRKVIAKFKSK